MSSGSALRVMFFTDAVYTISCTRASGRENTELRNNKKTSQGARLGRRPLQEPSTMQPPLGADGDGSHETTRVGALFTVAEEDAGLAGGAEVADVDVVGAEAELFELRAVGFAEVEEHVFRRRLVAGRHHVEPLDGVGFVAGAEFVEPVRGLGELGEEFAKAPDWF